MKKAKRRSWALSILSTALACAFLVGCDSSLAPILTSGHYEGTLTRRTNGKLTETLVRAMVSESATSGSDTIFSVVLTDLDGARQAEVYIWGWDGSSFRVALPDLGVGSAVLTQDQDCFMTSNPANIRVCPQSNAILVEVTDRSQAPLFSLSLNYFPTDGTVLHLEQAQSFTLTQGMSRAFSMNFGTRIEFERVMQARHQAANAYESLFPHLSASSILAMAQPLNVYSILSVIGDLAPFLLPSRWYRADQDQYLAEAEADSLLIMRADAGVQVEGLFYTITRDQTILQDYLASIKEAEGLLAEVQRAESLGRFPAGIADTLKTSINAAETDVYALRSNINEQMANVSQALGYINPKTVRSIELAGESLPISKAVPLKVEELMQAVADRSFECRQMSSLIAAAQAGKEASEFTWMDPSLDSALGLGLGIGLGDAVAVQQGNVAQLQVTEQQLEATILQKLNSAVSDYDNSLEDYQRATSDLDLQQRRVQRLILSLHFSKDINLVDLANVFQDRLRAEINQLNAVAVFRMSRAKLDRLLLRNYYAHLSILDETPAGAMR